MVAGLWYAAIPQSVSRVATIWTQPQMQRSKCSCHLGMCTVPNLIPPKKNALHFTQKQHYQRLQGTSRDNLLLFPEKNTAAARRLKWTAPWHLGSWNLRFKSTTSLGIAASMMSMISIIQYIYIYINTCIYSIYIHIYDRIRYNL